MQNPDNFVLSGPDDFAIYLPAVNPDYQKFIDAELDAARPIPSGFSLDDLAFWTGTSKLWNHKYLLHSIGGYKVGTDTRGPLFRKHAGDFCFVGDCGGFQIGKGTLDGLKNLKQGISGKRAVEAWGDNYDAKLWIINWLERYCDYAMTIDMPLWAMTQAGVDSPFHNCTEDQLLAMTLKNLKLIDTHKQGRTKWLNVIQGTTPENTVRWWNEVKWFRDGGWSLAGAADHAATQRALDALQKRFGQHPWLSAKIAQLRHLADEDTMLMAKEVRYSMMRMSSRLASKSEMAYSDDETHLSESVMPSFLRKKVSEGKGKVR